ncbi:splicing factor YJU2-like [Eucalyptus grandis]|uniref:splicing factor YJU2-like n=1 Tax=Eucalyptus grandis TaxID=71139 RepID=UPI00192EA359|nr:splicing factor YJU2-like [Eucalyptus grandis]
MMMLWVLYLSMELTRFVLFLSWPSLVLWQTYLGNQRFRFYFTCTNCSAVLAIKTQPQHPDCEVDSGATRVVENGQRKREAEEMGDVNREIDILPALDDMNSMK